MTQLKFSTAVTFLLLALSLTAQAQQFPLDASQWVLDPQQTDQSLPFNRKGAVAFYFPRYPDDLNYTGYLLLPWTQPLAGSAFVATMQINTFPVDPTKPVRFIPAPNGDCISPAQAHVYFQTGELYNDLDGTRWWSNPVAWELQDGLITLSVPLDPAQWSSTFGHFGTELPAQFQNAMAHPTYVGVTFGGACSFAHGVSVRKGDARFMLSFFAVQ